MHIISRKKNESLVIGDSITLTVIEIRGDKVRLGIDAPHEVPVHRHEVWVRLTPAQRQMTPEQLQKELHPEGEQTNNGGDPPASEAEPTVGDALPPPLPPMDQPPASAGGAAA